MRGHEPIIAMRLTGKIPSIVFVNDFPCATDWQEFNDHATIQILPNESIETLDLRFLVLLTVSILASSLDSARRLVDACKGAGAKTVAAGSVVMTAGGYYETSWAEIWHRQTGNVNG